MKFLLFKIGFISLISFGLLACTSVDNKWNVNNSWCNEKTIPTANETIVLSADMLFKFDGYSFIDILPEGKKQLEQLVKFLKDNYHTINTIVLVGHTDRIGSDSYNQKLGFARAETIKNYLVSNGLETSYSVESKGKSAPVTTDCLNNTTDSISSLKSCLQPDRRVELYIEGEKSAPLEKGLTN